MRGLRGRAFIVTGGATGIGRAISQRLVSEGAGVAIAQLGAAGQEPVPGAWMAEADVRDQDRVAGFVTETVSRFGRLDGLVNNAAQLGPLAPILEHPPQLYRTMLATNLEGPFLFLTEVARVMAEAGTAGAIVNITSIAGMTAEEFAAGYMAAKFGLVGLTRSAAMELGEHKIRVNAVAPGPVMTPGALAISPLGGAPLTPKYARRAPLAPEVDPEDVAAAVAFLLSDDARAITGTVLPVDAGYLA
ncbi:MAG TPA: SDR family oxidoreductase [Streptosporangiaceae bacterium]|jgi:NAD(P)-dependent dehydrogenase (short-subunit alcohol dehydrogenase family)